MTMIEYSLEYVKPAYELECHDYRFIADLRYIIERKQFFNHDYLKDVHLVRALIDKCIEPVVPGFYSVNVQIRGIDGVLDEVTVPGWRVQQ